LLPQLKLIEPYRYEPLQPFEHVEHGKEADPTFKDLLKPGCNLADLTASIGAEVAGVQLTSLDNTGKDQLALLAAQKKVVGERWLSLSRRLTQLTISLSVP
jgi:sulfonate dioxygenase